MEEEGEGPVDALAFPLLAQGHIIPFMRLCELLSSKNLNVVFLTSPLNANRLRTKNNDSSSSSRVRVMDIPLPPVPGLPAGAENTDQLTSGPQFELLFAAIENMEPSFTKLVARLRPKCLIADLTPRFLPAVAQKLKIPVFFYATTGAYSLTMMEAVTNSLPLPLPLPTGESTAVLPALPKPVSFNDRDFLHPFRGAGRPSIAHRLFSMFFEHIRRSAGLVMNTFEEMDAGFVDHVRNAFRVPVWSVGPVLNRPSDTEWGLVEQWLDCRVAGSVVYVNFGSEIALSGEQIKEVAAGLEASGQCFVWAVKKPPAGEVPEAEGDGVLFTVPTGFEERTADRGLLIAGWAPQQAILSHSSTGGFLSHCGWNSTLESMINGVPMLAWPFQHDQPFVKKLLVEELGVAKEVKRETVGDGVFVVKSAEVERAVKLIIEEGKGRDMRKRARELKAAAMRAVEEGGSSFTNLQNFISHPTHSLRVNSSS